MPCQRHKLLKKALGFIREHQDQPFFLLYAPPLPHTKWQPANSFKGSSAQGAYGDVVQELDWQVGEILKELDSLKLAERTLVVFASDNGPQLNVDGHGSSGVFRDGKWSNFEGGIRVPCIMRWPGKIPHGSVNAEITGIIDMLPTFCKIAKTSPPKDRIIDGRNILPYMMGESPAKPVHESWVVPGKTIRMGDWKLFTKKEIPGGGNSKTKGKTDRKMAKAGSLFNLREDPGETKDVSDSNPTTVKHLTESMNKFQSSFQNQLRPSGQLPTGK